MKPQNVEAQCFNPGFRKLVVGKPDAAGERRHQAEEKIDVRLRAVGHCKVEMFRA